MTPNHATTTFPVHSKDGLFDDCGNRDGLLGLHRTYPADFGPVSDVEIAEQRVSIFMKRMLLQIGTG